MRLIQVFIPVTIVVAFMGCACQPCQSGDAELVVIPSVDETEVRIYDVRDLLVGVYVPPQVSDPSFDLQDSDREQILFEKWYEQAQHLKRQDYVDSLVSTIIKEVATAEAWTSEDDPRSIKELNGNLIIRATPKDHNEVLKILGKLRESRSNGKSVGARFISDEELEQQIVEAFLEDFDITFESR